MPSSDVKITVETDKRGLSTSPNRRIIWIKDDDTGRMITALELDGKACIELAHQLLNDPESELDDPANKLRGIIPFAYGSSHGQPGLFPSTVIATCHRVASLQL